MAIKQLTQGASEILTRSAKTHSQSDAVRMITIGGDHTISEFTFYEAKLHYRKNYMLIRE